MKCAESEKTLEMLSSSEVVIVRMWCSPSPYWRYDCSAFLKIQTGPRRCSSTPSREKCEDSAGVAKTPITQWHKLQNAIRLFPSSNPATGVCGVKRASWATAVLRRAGYLRAAGRSDEIITRDLVNGSTEQ
jgi:hypothetical protein